MIEFGLSEEEELIRSTARQFAEQRLRPREREHEQAGVAATLVREYAELAFPAIDLPVEIGGQGLGLFVKCLVLEELGRADAGATLALDGLGPALSFVVELPAERARRLVEPFLAGADRRGAVFTDWERVLHLEDRRLSGAVPWVPAGRVDLLAVLHGSTAYFVTRGAAVKASSACGLAAAGSGEVTLQRAEVVDTLDVPQAVQRAFARLRCYAAALLVGVARAALEYAVRYTQERVVFGKPIAHHQGPAFLMAEMRTGLEAARLALWRAASLVDRGAAAALPAAAAAFGEAADQALSATQQAVQLLGGHGFVTDHPVEKWMRDARTLALLWGGRDAALGEAATGLWPAADPTTAPRDTA